VRVSHSKLSVIVVVVVRGRWTEVLLSTNFELVEVVESASEAQTMRLLTCRSPVSLILSPMKEGSHSLSRICHSLVLEWLSMLVQEKHAGAGEACWHDCKDIGWRCHWIISAVWHGLRYVIHLLSS
jgi:hypothetical protein